MDWQRGGYEIADFMEFMEQRRLKGKARALAANRSYHAVPSGSWLVDNSASAWSQALINSLINSPTAAAWDAQGANSGALEGSVLWTSLRGMATNQASSCTASRELWSIYPPRYTARAVQVSATTTSTSMGSRGLSRRQIHTAISSLVGFFSPGISLR